MLASAVRLSAGAVVSATARWSPYSLLVLIVISFITIILLAVLLILLISGRFSAHRGGPFAPTLEDEEAGLPDAESLDDGALAGQTTLYPDEMDDDYDDIDDDYIDEPTGDTATPAEDKAIKQPSPFLQGLKKWFSAFMQRPWRSNGLWQLLVAILMGPVAALCWLGLESIYGQLRAFTDCTLLLLLLLAVQIIMVVQLWRRQRGR